MFSLIKRGCMSDELLRQILTEVRDLKLQVERLELHLKRQDKEAMEILAASRRLMIAVEAIETGDEDPLNISQN